MYGTYLETTSGKSEFDELVGGRYTLVRMDGSMNNVVKSVPWCWRGGVRAWLGLVVGVTHASGGRRVAMCMGCHTHALQPQMVRDAPSAMPAALIK